MKRLDIIEYKRYESVTLYTVHLEGEGQNETDKFISKFQSSDDHQGDYQTIIYWINRIGKTGALERYFRPEKRAKAMPIDSCNLRLYCARISDQILVLGNGGVKTSKKVKNSPDCYPHFLLMNNVLQKLSCAITRGETRVSHQFLKGRLKFKVEDNE